MKIRSRHGVLYEKIGDHEWILLGVETADAIARANDYMHAEQIVEAIKGKDAQLDENLKVIEIGEDFLP